MEPVPGLSPDQQFWIAVMDRAIPLALEVLKILGIVAAGWVSWLTFRKQVKSEARLEQVHDQLNGRMTQLLDEKDERAEEARKRAHAEGVTEGVAAVALTPTPAPTVIVQPIATSAAQSIVPGGRRREDPPAAPVPPPPQPPVDPRP